MTQERVIKSQIVIVTDDEAEIKKGDLFYFTQSGSSLPLPTIGRHMGRKGENWNGFKNSATGQRSYLKIISISIGGVMFTPNGYWNIHHQNPAT